MFGVEPKFPYVLGSDGAGTVAAVGEQANRFKEGDRVYAAALINPKGGFYAQYIAVKSANVSHIPGKLTIEEAGVMPSDAMTALRGLDDMLSLKEGETLMIFGAGGGIGHLAVQLAKRMGARVFAVASGDDGVALAKRLGAEFAINGRKDDVVAAAREFASGGGRAAHPNGVMPEPKASPGVLLSSYDVEPSQEVIAKLNRLIEAGPFEVHIARTFPLDRAAEAHRALDDHYLGKLALRLS